MNIEIVEIKPEFREDFKNLNVECLRTLYFRGKKLRTRIKNQEPRTKNQEPRTKNQEPRIKNQESRKP